MQQLDEVWAGLHLFLSLHLRQAVDGIFKRGSQAGYVDVGALQQRAWPVVLPEHGQQHMGGFDVGIVFAQGHALGIGQGFLEFAGEFVDSHE